MASERQRSTEARPAGPTPARLYALLCGGALLLGGVAGFFFEPSFGTGDQFKADEILGTFPTNGWDNLLHMLAGLAGLALASRAAGVAALGLGALLTLLALWGIAVTDHGNGTIAGLLPVSSSDNALHLLVGLVGLASGLAAGGARAVRAAAERLPPVPLPSRSRSATARGARRRSARSG